MKSIQYINQGKRYARFWCPGCQRIHEVNEEWEISPEIGPLTIYPSILTRHGNTFEPEHEQRCHSYVTGDQIQFLDDCTHHLRGIHPLPHLPQTWVQDAQDHDDRICHPKKGTHASPHRGCILR